MHCQVYSLHTDDGSLLERLVLVLCLVLHHHLAALTHSEGKSALHMLRVTQLVQMLSENLSQIRGHLLIKCNLHKLQRERERQDMNLLETNVTFV